MTCQQLTTISALLISLEAIILLSLATAQPSIGNSKQEWQPKRQRPNINVRHRQTTGIDDHESLRQDGRDIDNLFDFNPRVLFLTTEATILPQTDPTTGSTASTASTTSATATTAETTAAAATATASTAAATATATATTQTKTDPTTGNSSTTSTVSAAVSTATTNVTAAADTNSTVSTQKENTTTTASTTTTINTTAANATASTSPTAAKSTLGTSSPTTTGPSTNIDEYDAVIVGAGWAGLKAAKTLLEEGITSILILEANNFVGGRARSVNSDGSINVPPDKLSPNNISRPIWEWLYLEEDHLEPYLRRNGFIDRALEYGDKETMPPGLYNKTQFYLQTKKGDGTITTNVLSEDDADDFEERVWGGFWNFRLDLLDRLDGGEVSYKAALMRYIQEEEIVNNDERQYLHMIVSAGQVDNAADRNSFSLKRRFDYFGLTDRTHYQSTLGLGSGNIAASYFDSFRSKVSLKLNAKVTEIRQDEGSESNTISYVENGEARKVVAKTVLVTVSLGVLRAGDIAFTPNGLPQAKQEVVDGIGWGVMNKCVMYWNDTADVVWPEDKVWFQLITNDAASSYEWTSFFNPTEFKKTPVLVGFIGGNEAIAAEEKSDEEILDANMKNLKAMFPNITRPEKVIVTRWGQDEFVRGTYPFHKVGRNFKYDAYTLRERFGRIWFAGEATANGWSGTTAGAWNTGEEAARSMVSTLCDTTDDTTINDDDNDAANGIEALTEDQNNDKAASLTSGADSSGANFVTGVFARAILAVVALMTV